MESSGSQIKVSHEDTKRKSYENTNIIVTTALCLCDFVRDHIPGYSVHGLAQRHEDTKNQTDRLHCLHADFVA